MAFSWETKESQRKKTAGNQQGFSWNKDPGSFSNRRQVGVYAQEARYRSSFKGMAVETAKNFPLKLWDTAVAGYRGAVEGWKGVKGKENVNDITKYPENIRKSVDEAARSWGSTVDDTAQRFTKAYDAWNTTNTTLLDRGVATGMAGLGVVNTAFASITSGLQAASGIPGIGPAATTVEKLFAAIGNGSAALGVESLYNLPISEEKKKKLEPLVGETAALVGMIVAGGKAHSEFAKVKKNVDVILEDIKAVDPVRVAEVLDRTPGVGTNAPRQITAVAEPTRIGVQRVGSPKGERVPVRQAYEPYLPEGQLPVIQAQGRSPAGETKFSWQKKEAPAETAPAETIGNRPVEPKTGQTRPPAQPVPEPATGFVSETAKRTVELARSQGLPVSNPPVQQTRPSAFKSAYEFAKTKTEDVMNILEGRVGRPPEYLPGELYRAAEKVAIENGDVGLINRLSRLTTGTEAGRTLESFNQDIGFANSVIEALHKIELGKQKAKEVELREIDMKATKEVEKINSKPPKTWDELVQQITCKI